MTTGFSITCDGCNEVIEIMDTAWIGPDMTGEAMFGVSIFHDDKCAWRYHDRIHPDGEIGCTMCADHPSHRGTP